MRAPSIHWTMSTHSMLQCMAFREKYERGNTHARVQVITWCLNDSAVHAVTSVIMHSSVKSDITQFNSNCYSVLKYLSSVCILNFVSYLFCSTLQSIQKCLSVFTNSCSKKCCSHHFHQHSFDVVLQWMHLYLYVIFFSNIFSL